MKYIKLFEKRFEIRPDIYEIMIMDPVEVYEIFIDEIRESKPDLELIRDILAYSTIDINKKDSRGYPPLIIAARYEHELLIEFLLNQPNINVNVKDKEDCTALYRALFLNNEPIAKMLLNHPEIDVNIQNEDGQTALMNAVWSGNEGIINSLLNRPEINIKLKNKYGNTAWDLARVDLRRKFPQLNPFHDEIH
jgi:ankyrin repeat protein